MLLQKSTLLVVTASLSAVSIYQVWQFRLDFVPWLMANRTKCSASTSSSTDDQIMSFLHVTSPFKSKDDCVQPFCPFDQERGLALKSMQRAKNMCTKNASVVLAAATFPEDSDAVPSDFVRLDPLSRSTASEYPHLANVTDTGSSFVKKIPFIQDIFDRALNLGMEFDYLVYTNSDIILHERFYDIIQEQIEKEGYDVLNIFRQTILDHLIGSGQTDTLDDIYAITNKKDLHGHAGSDCFVIHRSVLEKIQMGDIFLGAPFVSPMLVLQSEHFAQKAKRFGSFELKATYHLGNDKTWLDKANSRYSHINGINAMCRLGGGKWSKFCAEKQWNYLYCGRLKGKIRRFLDRDFDFKDTATSCQRHLSTLIKSQ